METLSKDAHSTLPRSNAVHSKFELTDRNILPVSTYLEQIITTLLEAVNAKDRDFMAQATRRYFTPEVQVERASEPFATPIAAVSVEEYITNLITYVTKYNFMIKPYNTSALVDEAKGKAMVFTTVSTIGTDYARKGLAIETVLAYYFHRGRDKEWRCNRFEIMRGPGRFWLDACNGYQS